VEVMEDVYECTSLDGPHCPWLNGDEDPTDSAAVVQRLLQQLLQPRPAKAATADSSTLSSSDSTDPSQSSPEGEDTAESNTLDLAALVQHLFQRARSGGKEGMNGEVGEGEEAEEVGGSDGGVGMEVDVGEEAEGEEEVEFELVAIEEDGETRPMTEEELQRFTREILAGNVHIEYDDEGEEEGEDGDPDEEGGQDLIDRAELL
jgi:hypothetical protein